MDGNSEERRGTISPFNGPAPEMRDPAGQEEENDPVAAWLAVRASNGVAPHEMAVFSLVWSVRKARRLTRQALAGAVQQG